MAAPTDDDMPPFPDDAVEVGRIAGAWGVRGALRVQPYAASPQALFGSRRWFLRPPEGPRAAAPLPVLLRITSAREHGQAIVASAEGVADRDAAEALRGARVFVSRASFPTPQAGEYYWVDLIGARVVNRDGVDLGQVHALMDLGPHAVLQVRPDDPQAEERLIPFVAAYVDDVDVAARRIRVDWSLDY
ncbi:ribosome maturation factor RimM [Calidifontimicrobium sp. SYSU G02091]|uniref:ribosome maturation factor RimM n=1 Tax=Calidifontimicrobium sp. SYSU G02091 TaxID=2926421 RepID=UPI001F53DE8A|nr:ribosome maturation factor RimM [Calidifontimicrobium sp. SYSU G02091]MCI1192294.1 ribosome maturation factor RimM [Calidifontimicrobium sp. SYSU G02091]